MARNLYSGTFTQYPTGLPAAGAPFTIWTDALGGVNVTGQVVAIDGVSVYLTTTSGNGNVLPFRGPDGYNGFLFIDTGGEVRYGLQSPTAWDTIVSAVGSGSGTGSGGISTVALENYLATTGTPQRLYAASGGTGAYPSRPATLRPVDFYGAVEPPSNGSTSGGGGMVPNKDQWIYWVSQQ